jgi:hypothetical protein
MEGYHTAFVRHGRVSRRMPPDGVKCRAWKEDDPMMQTKRRFSPHCLPAFMQNIHNPYILVNPGLKNRGH